VTLAAGHVAGRSVVHRAPPGLKLAVVFTGAVVVLVVDEPWFLGAAIGLTLLLYAVAGLRIGHLWRILRPLLVFLALLVGFRSLTSSPAEALGSAVQVAVMVLLGGLLVFTTRVSAMLALFQRLLAPLERLGVDPRRVALVLALTMRAIPLAAESWQRCREAYQARGLRRRGHLMVVPLVVDLIRRAEATGEAMIARGLD
jgi:biotin transport system permease protein